MACLKLGVCILLVQLYLSGAEKPGVCPRAVGYGSCATTCGADEDCEGIKKCCSNGCGAWCTEPTCPVGQTKVDCPLILCNYAGCPNKSQGSLRCSVTFCDQCKVNFYNTTTGEQVNCGPVETLCPRMQAASKKIGLMPGQYIPKCDAKGAFQQVQCHEGYCFCVDKRGIPNMSTRIRGLNPKCPEKTLCQRQKEEALKLPPIGRFVPSCKEDGSFEVKQCHASTGQCWCVDDHGREWFGTRSRGSPLTCEQSVCPTGVTQLKCDPLICHATKCPGYEKATCRVNPCGKCQPEFLDEYNRRVKCLTKCQSQRNDALGITSPEGPTQHPVVGRYVPQCTPEGKYEQVQCYGSTGYCWCVDKEGSPVLGTIIRGVPRCNSSAVGVCPAGKPMFTCLRNMCEYTSCPAYPDARCRVDPCGTCKAEFLDKDGNVIQDCKKNMTDCVAKRSAALQTTKGGLQPVGRFVPTCDSKGNYEQIQCWGSIGYCWCVGSSGNEIEGTRVRGTPSCTATPTSTGAVAKTKDGFCPFKQPRDASFCASAPKCSSDGTCSANLKCCNSTCGKICQPPIITACPNGRPFLLCLHMCTFASCPASPAATCFSDPCRMCRVEFRDAKNNVVDCFKGLTDCQRRRKQAAGLLGAFRPQCDSSGNYEKLQRHEGYYWCVDSKGREINGTRQRFSKPTCDGNGKSEMSLCQLQAQQSQGNGDRPMVGRYVPQCATDGSFKQIQCHPSTGYCWCVNTTSGIAVPNTHKRGRPDCSKVCSPVMCMMYCQFGFVKDQNSCEICKCAPAPVKPGSCPSGVLSCSKDSKACQRDADCAGASKCCSTRCGHVCINAVFRDKPGQCPKRAVYHVGLCRSKCGIDSDCAGEHKCCSNGCGRECSAPARPACPYGQPVVMCFSNPCEIASCPANPKAKCRPNFCGTCSAQFFDERNRKVNCTSGLTTCQRQYVQATSRGLMLGAYIPQCDKDGRFSAMQYHGSSGYRWCVDPDTGKEINGTQKPPGQEDPKCLTLCQLQLAQATSSQPMPGKFIPQCEKDGRFSAMQRHGSSGYSWCVDPKTGKEIDGTKKSPTEEAPKCDATPPNGPTCPNNSKRFALCDPKLCATSNCTRNPRARCVVPMGACGTCRPKYYAYDGSEIQCMTECQQKNLEATQGGLLGAFKPTCNQDGTYKLIQCHASSGFCWCSSPDGREWPETRVRGNPKCQREKRPEIKHVHVKLTFNNNFDDIKDILEDFTPALKSQLCKHLSLKEEQMTELLIKSGSVVVEFNAVAVDGGKDIGTLAEEIYDKVRREDIVVRYGGMTFVASPQQVEASPQYSASTKEALKKGGLGTTAIALICVFVIVGVVIIGVVVVVVKKRRNRANTDTDTAGFLYKDGKAEYNSVPT